MWEGDEGSFTVRFKLNKFEHVGGLGGGEQDPVQGARAEVLYIDPH